MADNKDKVTTDVLIDGKVYSLTGAESGYMQEVASFINSKLKEVKAIPNYRNMDTEHKELLMYLNLADEYFSAMKEIEKLRSEAAEREAELYSVKHDAVAARMKLENALKEQETLEARVEEYRDKYEELRSKTPAGRQARRNEEGHDQKK